jgi:hypothetical protein
MDLVVGSWLFVVGLLQAASFATAPDNSQLTTNKPSHVHERLLISYRPKQRTTNRVPS